MGDSISNCAAGVLGICNSSSAGIAAHEQVEELCMRGVPVCNVQRLYQQPVFSTTPSPPFVEEALSELRVIPRPEHLVHFVHALHLFPKHAQALKPMTKAC